MANLYNWPHVPRRGGKLMEADLDAAQRVRDVDPWAVTRFADCEPYALNEMQRQAADEQAAHRHYAACQHALHEVYDPQPAHGTEGCADTSDEPQDDFAFARGLLLAMSATAVLAAIVVVLL